MEPSKAVQLGVVHSAETNEAAAKHLLPIYGQKKCQQSAADRYAASLSNFT